VRKFGNGSCEKIRESQKKLSNCVLPAIQKFKGMEKLSQELLFVLFK
jgi:hypothetical protein